MTIAAKSGTDIHTYIDESGRVQTTQLVSTVSGSSGASADQVQGNVDSGATDSGKPVKVGAEATAPSGLVTAGQRVNLRSDLRGNLRVLMMDQDGVTSAAIQPMDSDGRLASNAAIATDTRLMDFNGTTWDRVRGNTTGLIVIPPRGWSYAAAASGIVNSAVAVTIKAAAGAAVRNYLTGIQIATDTLGAATELAIRDGAAGTVLWRGKLQTTALALTTINFDTPLYSTANTLLEVVTLTAVTGGVYVNANGFTAP